MTVNTRPVFSGQGANRGGIILTTAANDYNGQSLNNKCVFVADATNGSYVQRLRFKALGTNTASVARVYVNNGSNPRATVISPVAGTPTGTPSVNGGTLPTTVFFAKVYAVDAWGGVTAAATETASVSVTGPTGSIAWAWNAVTGAASYIIAVGNATNAQTVQFTSTTNAYTQTTPGSTNATDDILLTNYFYGEVTLPGTTATATSATIDIDYPMNLMMKPGHSLIVGLGTTVAAGWGVTTVAGGYTALP